MNILNKLTIKHLTMNKKRTIVTIIGVLLSTALMVGIGLLLSTYREVSIDQIIERRGNYHVVFENMDASKVDIIKNNSNVSYVYTKNTIGYALIEENPYVSKPFYKLIQASNNYLKELHLKEGRYPENDQEIVISDHIRSLTGLKHNIGDTLKMTLGTRLVDDYPILDDYYHYGETFKADGKTVSYKIVGIVERDKYENYSDPGFSVFTYDDNLKENITTYIRYKNPGKSFDITETLAKNLNIPNKCNGETTCYDGVSYNDGLISMYGGSRYNNIISSLKSVLAIMLSVVSLGCIIVIYNSFAISVMERKKQFGLFSSIGATKSQLRKTVFFEALVVSMIGIPLGILSAYIGIGVVIMLMNSLIANVFKVTFHLCTYPIFIIIPILFMIITIFVSAFIPARKASKITPIEAIRLNDDIKIKGKKVKTPKIIRKIFGIEGDIALKNIKRNKRKYRITIASLFISIVMFVSFSDFMNYFFSGADSYTNLPEYDIRVIYDKSTSDKRTVEELKNNELIEEAVEAVHLYYYANSPLTKMYSDKYLEFLDETEIQNNSEYIGIDMIVLDQASFKAYLKKIGKTKEKPVLLNKFNGIVYNEASRQSKNLKRYKNNAEKVQIDIFEDTFDEKKHLADSENYYEEKQLILTIKDYYISEKSNLAINDYLSNTNPILIVSEVLLEKQLNELPECDLLLKTNDVDALDKKITDLIDADKLKNATKFNVAEEVKMVRNLIIMSKILVYGFVSLVTLIGVTSVFNTINTSIALRRKEFAMLRSMGLTPRGFNKILYFESIFVGLKSLLYGLSFALIVILLLHISMSGVVVFDSIMIPYKSILITIVGVFIIVIITMLYASRKIKNENILEAIREENI